jgi:hypothetical protein
MQLDGSVLRIAEYLERAIQAETKAATSLTASEREAFLAVAAYWHRRAEDTARGAAGEGIAGPPDTSSGKSD